MIRVRYFTNQILGAADFETEQRYVIERLRRRNRWLHAWGVVGGLQVSVSQSEIVVTAGFAIDCAGNEIEVGRPTAWPLPPPGSPATWPTRWKIPRRRMPHRAGDRTLAASLMGSRSRACSGRAPGGN